MDVTLWDAVDTYVVCWNKALERNGRKRITRAALLGMMGWEKEKVISHYLHDILKAMPFHLIYINAAPYLRLILHLTNLQYFAGLTTLD